VPNRRFFFAKNSAEAYSYRWVIWKFRQIRKMLKIEDGSGNLPRLYDLRHTFATHRLYQWMRDGRDLYACLPYLSSYMGHAKITETFHYIHLVPGMFETMSGFKYEPMAYIFPEAADVDE
jgi:integrase